MQQKTGGNTPSGWDISPGRAFDTAKEGGRGSQGFY